ncbi:unnamed protein product [Dicrocoelium dendriticum]|nr:unnamed protein product [Dicrocoelium dendriticum]
MAAAPATVLRWPPRVRSSTRGGEVHARPPPASPPRRAALRLRAGGPYVRIPDLTDATPPNGPPRLRAPTHARRPGAPARTVSRQCSGGRRLACECVLDVSFPGAPPPSPPAAGLSVVGVCRTRCSLPHPVEPGYVHKHRILSFYASCGWCSGCVVR